VEARQDTMVVIHSLTDHRRQLPLDKTGEVVHAHLDFQLGISYNPGYQSVLKDLKQSTKQRFVGFDFDFDFDYPAPALEAGIVSVESGLPQVFVSPIHRTCVLIWG
jgi:nitric oxide reductase NorQ protein